MFFMASKILMRLNVVFLEILQRQNVLIMFLFSMEHSYLLMANTPPGLNDSLIFPWYEGAAEVVFGVLWAILCLLGAAFGVWLWPRLAVKK